MNIIKIATRVVAGITGKGSKSVNPVYRNSNSVKVIKPQSTNPKVNQSLVQSTNDEKSFITSARKTGKKALGESYRAQWSNFTASTVKKPTVKINSNLKRSK